MTEQVYLLHLSDKMHHAQHYIGWASDLEGRLYHHRHKRGAKMLAAACDRNIEFHVARTWQGKDRNFERKLKNYKKSRRLCPVCSGDSAYKRMKGDTMNDNVTHDADGYMTFVDKHGTIWKMWGDGWTAYKNGKVCSDTLLFTTSYVTMPSDYDIEKAYREYNNRV